MCRGTSNLQGEQQHPAMQNSKNAPEMLLNGEYKYKYLLKQTRQEGWQVVFKRNKNGRYTLIINDDVDKQFCILFVMSILCRFTELIFIFRLHLLRHSIEIKSLSNVTKWKHYYWSALLIQQTYDEQAFLPHDNQNIIYSFQRGNWKQSLL